MVCCHALPVVAVPQGEDALSWASAYYANAFGRVHCEFKSAYQTDI